MIKIQYTDDSMREQTKLVDLPLVIADRRLAILGHIIRLKEETTAHTMLQHGINITNESPLQQAGSVHQVSTTENMATSHRGSGLWEWRDWVASPWLFYVEIAMSLAGPYSSMLFCANSSSLASRTEDLSYSFFCHIVDPASCLHSLLPPHLDRRLSPQGLDPLKSFLKFILARSTTAPSYNMALIITSIKSNKPTFPITPYIQRLVLLAYFLFWLL